MIWLIRRGKEHFTRQQGLGFPHRLNQGSVQKRPRQGILAQLDDTCQDLVDLLARLGRLAAKFSGLLIEFPLDREAARAVRRRGGELMAEGEMSVEQPSTQDSIGLPCGSPDVLSQSVGFHGSPKHPCATSPFQPEEHFRQCLTTCRAFSVATSASDQKMRSTLLKDSPGG